jgi:dTDP-4-dehydrorhamnose reductase
VLLVTGGSGFLGRHLGRLADHPWQVVAPPSSVLDVRREDAVRDAVREWRPQAIVHLAYRRDDRRTIVDGSAHVARAAGEVGARLVHLSTDLVFAGRSRPYNEQDPPDATQDYGRWKADAERRVLDASPDAVVVRTSLLYGTEDPGDQLAMVQQASRTGRPAFFTDEIRCPTHVDDVAAAILTLAGRSDAAHQLTGPLHVASPEALSRADFARTLATWSGIDPASLPVTTLADRGADRPGCVILDSSLAAAQGIGCRPATSVLRS